VAEQHANHPLLYPGLHSQPFTMPPGPFAGGCLPLPGAPARPLCTVAALPIWGIYLW